MDWIDIASIVFVSVTMNHLGLIAAIEAVIKHKLPIVNCPKCLTCWSVLAYMVVTAHSIVTSLAISFLASYIAIWLELFEGFIDSLYMKLYEKIYSDTDDDTLTAADFEDNPDCSVS